MYSEHPDPSNYVGEVYFITIKFQGYLLFSSPSMTKNQDVWIRERLILQIVLWTVFLSKLKLKKRISKGSTF